MNEYYKILNALETMQLKEIKKSYLVLIRENHPDIDDSENALLKSKIINSAWDWIKKNHKPVLIKEKLPLFEDITTQKYEDVYVKSSKSNHKEPSINLYYSVVNLKIVTIEIPQSNINQKTHVLNIYRNKNYLTVVIIKKNTQLPFSKFFVGFEVCVINTEQAINSSVYDVNSLDLLS